MMRRYCMYTHFQSKAEHLIKKIGIDIEKIRRHHNLNKEPFIYLFIFFLLYFHNTCIKERNLV